MRRVRRQSFVHSTFELRKKSKRLEIGVVHASNFEHVVRTNFDTIAFTFAFRSVHQRHVGPGGGATFLSRAIGMFGGTTRFGFARAFVIHRAHDTTSRRTAKVKKRELVATNVWIDATTARQTISSTQGYAPVSQCIHIDLVGHRGGNPLAQFFGITRQIVRP